MTTLPDTLRTPLADLLLAVADDKLMLGHRNSDWTGLGPILEEDIAFSSLAQDEIAHASALYEHVGAMLGTTADALAFGREPSAYRCASIVEVPDEFDWATALCRQFFCDHFDVLRLSRLARSREPDLAALCRRLHAEERVHVEHVDGWMRRLGHGTEESHQRTQAALTALAPHAVLLAEPVPDQDLLEADGLYPPLEGDADMYTQWSESLTLITGAANLDLTLPPPPTDARGGRHGRHSAHFKDMLDEMCEVYRVEPGAAW